MTLTRTVGVLASALVLLGAVMQFTQPRERERAGAIGPMEGLPEPVRRALEPGEDFEPVPQPGPHDWLANHSEPGQTFEEFLRSRPLKPDKKRNKLYLQPLGDFGRDKSPSLERLRRFAAAFFMMDVAVLPPLDITEARITTRQNPFTGNTQLLTGDILRLLRKKLPDDAFALLGITMIDLYPDESWNFVFGQASLRERVGVYSFVRYDPRFYTEGAPSRSERPPDGGHGPAQPGRGDDAGDDTAKHRLTVPPGRDDDASEDTAKLRLTMPPGRQKLMLRRSCKVLAHETCHMFGIQHCIYFRCLMNGSNHLAESDSRPLHLCPVDLRKLQYSVGFDVIERYRRLREFYQEAGLADEARWLAKRLEHIAIETRNDQP